MNTLLRQLLSANLVIISHIKLIYVPLWSFLSLAYQGQLYLIIPEAEWSHSNLPKHNTDTYLVFVCIEKAKKTNLLSWPFVAIVINVLQSLVVIIC